MRGRWEVYVCPIENEVSLIALDLGIADELPLAGMDWLVAVSIALQKPVGRGEFINQDEYEVLCEIEEELLVAISEKAKGIQVGRVTGGGMRDLLFYVPSTVGISRIVEEVLVPFDYIYKIHQQEEPKWATYWEFLYPNPWQVQMIENRHLVERLSEQGDDSEIVRSVDHYAYFENREKARLFGIEVDEWGKEWEVFDYDEKEGMGELSWETHIICTQKADLLTINQKSGKLFEAAYHLGGQYGGWGTSVRKREE